MKPAFRGVQPKKKSKAAQQAALVRNEQRHHRKVRAGMLHETVQIASYSAIALLAVSVALAFIYWTHVSSAYLLQINAAMLVLVAAVIGMTLRTRVLLRTAVSEAFICRGILLSRLMALLIGLVWSTVPAVLIPMRESGYQMIAVAATSGLISCAYVVGPFLSVSMLFVAPIVLGGFWGLGQCDYPSSIYISTLLFVYAVFVVFSTRRMSILSYQRLLDRVVVQDQSQTIGLLLNEFEQGASDWLWETDADGYLRHAPSRMSQALGLQNADLSGIALADLLLQYEYRSKDKSGVEDVVDLMNRREPFRDHAIHLQTTEGARWWRLNGKPSFDARAGASTVSAASARTSRSPGKRKRASATSPITTR